MFSYTIPYLKEIIIGVILLIVGWVSCVCYEMIKEIKLQKRLRNLDIMDKTKQASADSGKNEE